MKNILTRQHKDKKIMESAEDVLAYKNLPEVLYPWLFAPQIKTTLRLINNQLKNVQKEVLYILDMGCGDAKIPLSVIKNNKHCKIYAVDLSMNMLEIAAENALQEGYGGRINFLCENCQKTSFQDDFFDIVTHSFLMHHLEDPLPVLQEMKRVAKTTGIIFITDLLRPRSEFMLEFNVKIFGFLYNEIQQKEYRNSLYSAFSLEEFKKILQEAGMNNVLVSTYFPHFVNIICDKRNL